MLLLVCGYDAAGLCAAVAGLLLTPGALHDLLLLREPMLLLCRGDQERTMPRKKLCWRRKGCCCVESALARLTLCPRDRKIAHANNPCRYATPCFRQEKREELQEGAMCLVQRLEQAARAGQCAKWLPRPRHPARLTSRIGSPRRELLTDRLRRSSILTLHLRFIGCTARCESPNAELRRT